jgi:hypothetical protein
MCCTSSTKQVRGVWAAVVFILSIVSAAVDPLNKALICPMACQLRSPDNLSKAMTDLPADYYTETMFALGIIQAPDQREHNLGHRCD